jgi:hypothetical protein
MNLTENPLNAPPAHASAFSGAPASIDQIDDTLAADTVETSFGVFKPVGSVMVGLPTSTEAAALVKDLQQAGWPSSALSHFKQAGSVAELEQMVNQAGPLSGFGYEITLLRRYLTLAREGVQWLLVKVDDGDHAALAAEKARGRGALLAVYYRTLIEEDLI